MSATTGMPHIDEFWDSFKFLGFEYVGGKDPWDSPNGRKDPDNGTMMAFYLASPARKNEKVVVAFASHDEAQRIGRAFHAFIDDFVVKTDNPVSYIVESVAEGGTGRYLWTSFYNPRTKEHIFFHKDQRELAARLLKEMRDTCRESPTRVLPPVAEQVRDYIIEVLNSEGTSIIYRRDIAKMLNVKEEALDFTIEVAVLDYFKATEDTVGVTGFARTPSAGPQEHYYHMSFKPKPCEKCGRL